MQATKHDDQLVLTIFLRLVPVDLLGYRIDGPVSGDNRYLAWVQECYCVTNLVHNMLHCGNGVSLISLKRLNRALMLTSNVALLFLDAWWADQVTFTVPSTSSVTQTFFSHSYSSTSCGFSKSVPCLISPSVLGGEGFLFVTNTGRILV